MGNSRARFIRCITTIEGIYIYIYINYNRCIYKTSYERIPFKNIIYI